jgi:hypothetical protein
MDNNTIAFVVWKKDDFFSNNNPHHSACGTLLAGVTNGSDMLNITYCPICKVIDTQAVQAFTIAMQWVHETITAPISDLSFTEYGALVGPNAIPPVGPYSRVWSLDATRDDTHDEILAYIILLPDGTFTVNTDRYVCCGEITQTTNCDNYVTMVDGAYVCSVHGVITPYDAANDN